MSARDAGADERAAKAADYIAAEFQQLGLKPGGLNDTYFQPYTMRAGRPKPVGANSVTLKGPLGQESSQGRAGFQIVRFAGSGTVTARWCSPATA